MTEPTMSVYILYNRYLEYPQHSASAVMFDRLPFRRGDTEVRRYDGFPVATWERWWTYGSQLHYLEEDAFWRDLFAKGVTVWTAPPRIRREG